MSRRFHSLDALIRSRALKTSTRPLALIIVEDDVEVASTLEHHLRCGFDPVIAVIPRPLILPDGLEAQVLRVDYDPGTRVDVIAAVNAVAAAAEGRWMYWGYSAEYLFYPFSETRNVVELLAFHTEERRQAMMAMVIDLYAQDLGQYPNGVNLEAPYLDSIGYYALDRHGEEGVKENQADIFGGLRWRFEEHVPWEKRRIDRVALFRAQAGVTMRPDMTFSDETYNTYACPWHHNMTAAVMSFRTAKALRANPGSRDMIDTFNWSKSQRFTWTSDQLMELGFLEAGQWF